MSVSRPLYVSDDRDVCNDLISLELQYTTSQVKDTHLAISLNDSQEFKVDQQRSVELFQSHTLKLLTHMPAKAPVLLHEA